MKNVNKEVAIMLKELGFDWECCTRYTTVDENVYTNYLDELNAYSYHNWNQYDKSISAPNLSKVQKWLREVYNYDIFVVNDGGVEHYCYRGIIVDKNKEDRQFYKNNPHIKDNMRRYFEYDAGAYSTYEQALSEAMEQALNLIIYDRDEANTKL